ncbi:hypothetical protein [Methylomonas fluvii]|nr:hypothetical protein [Methylomonas fluvii]
MRFGSITVTAGGRTDALWVVDGQQRIVSMARILLASEADNDAFALYFDLDRIEFVPPPSAAAQSGDAARWLPMTEVLDSERLFQWLMAKSSISKERRDRAFQLGKRIREYDIPAYVVRTDSEEILREVFSRVNSTGKGLKAPQVFDALHGARTHSRPATIKDIVTELEPLGFGRVEEQTLYKLLRVLQGVPVIQGGSDGPLRLSLGEAEQAYRQTTEAAKRVIQFLKEESGIPHYELLPYKQPLVTLGKFFSHHPAANARSRDLLVRWLWRGALNGSHQGDTVSTRKALDRIDPDNEALSVQRMLDMVKQKPDIYPSATEPFNFRYSASKLQALALIALAPRDLESGKLLHLGEKADRLFDQEIPFHQVLAYKTPTQNGLYLSAANRLAHPHRSGGLRRLLLNVADPAVLVSHGITDVAMQALRDGDAAQFLILRAEHLQRHFERFFEQYARWDEPDRPPLASLIVSDEEE